MLFLNIFKTDIMRNLLAVLVILFFTSKVIGQATDTLSVSFIGKTALIDLMQISNIKQVAKNPNHYDFRLKVYGDWDEKAEKRAINIGQVSGLTVLEPLIMGGKKNRFVITYSTYELKD